MLFFGLFYLEFSVGGTTSRSFDCLSILTRVLKIHILTSALLQEYRLNKGGFFVVDLVKNQL